MHFAVDNDDVVLDFWTGILTSWTVEFGETLPWAGPWDDGAVKGNPRLKAAGYKDWWAWMRDREWLWATFPAVPGAVAGVKTLRARGNFVELVTAKPEWAEHNVWKWLGKWRPPFNRVTITQIGQRKVDMTEADCIIDDKPSTCMEFAEAGRQAILFDRRPRLIPDPDGDTVYTWPQHPNLYVATDWDEVLSTAALLQKEHEDRVANQR